MTQATTDKPKRKPRREGSIEQLGPKRWRVRLFVGRSTTGTRKGFDEVVAGTRKDATAKLDEFRRLKSAPGFNGIRERVTLEEWCEEYFKLWAGHLRPRTRDSYVQVLRLYLPDTLRVLPLTKLSARAVQAWLIDLSKRVSTRGRKQSADGIVSAAPSVLSRRTVVYCRAALRLVVEEAVRQEMLQSNVVARTRIASESSTRNSHATLLESESGSAPPDEAVSVFDHDELGRFLQETAKRTDRLDGESFAGRRDHVAPYWRLALETALRPSELLGLRWVDVQLDASQDGKRRPHLTVRHSLTSAKGDGVLDPPKTLKSRRKVPFSTTCAELLRQHLERQNADRVHAAGSYHELDFVFATSTGQPIEINNLRKQVFQKLLKAAGITHGTLYTLRHTAITNMLSNGVHVLLVAQRAGHASAKMTLDIYGHVLPGQQDEATALIGEGLDRLVPET